MPELTLREAIARALREALDGNPNVFLMGEDIGAYGGAYAVTKGFLKEYGPERIRDTPISESTIVGAGIGAAMAGLRPVVELMTINFSLMATDQLINHAAKIHSMSGGQLKAPLIVRTVTGGGAGLAATHSQSLEGWYATIPGLKVVAPSTPADALGLFRSCMKDQNTVLFCEHQVLYGTRGPVPEEYYEVPLGQAGTVRQGSDITLIGYSRTVHVALRAARELERRGVQAEVLDLRTLRPLDVATVVASVKKTHRALIVEDAWATGAFGTYLGFLIHQQAFDDLDGPVAHVAGADVPMPYARNLEQLALPTEQSVLKAVQESFGL
ncbi:MAG: alpha-ketoacid dehydrogenase subunit beta [Chloroflexi bacterium]|nr:alpha-ketoacid dehydrogenase subunit beta [Chloroflexota bacterium]